MAASKEQITEYLDRGVRDLWYPVAASWEVNDTPMGITRLGENLVLWRDAAGFVHALEDRCPHRGARLSMGWNLGDRIACWYHGVEVGSDGSVKDVPAAGSSCPLIGQRCIRSYPVQEVHGALFVWFGVEADAEPAALRLPLELESPEYSSFLCTAAWSCNYQYALDNVMDPMHGAYLHASSHSMADGDRKAELQVVPTATGFMFEKTGQKGVNFDWTEFGETGTYWLRLSIPYRQRFGPGGPFWIVGIVTPVAGDHCRVFFWRIRKVDGVQRDMWRFLYRTRLEQLHWDVLEQDRVVLEDLAPDARDREFLYDHDIGLSRLRRQMRRAAESQLARIEATRSATDAVEA